MIRKGLLAALICAVPALAANLYWYNGDSDGFGASINNAGGTNPGVTYDNFEAGPGGIVVTGVFSSNAFDFFDNPVDPNITQAKWEIRSGMSNGNGGTLVGSGTGSVTETSLGTLVFNGLHYQAESIEVDGLNVFLTPGAYWLAVVPILDTTTNAFNAFILNTGGTGGFGSPQALDGNSFVDSADFGSAFGPAIDLYGGVGFGDPLDGAGSGNVDFSMGIVTTPEPGTLGLGAAVSVALAGLALARRRRV
jgi:hypothetical protein